MRGKTSEADQADRVTWQRAGRRVAEYRLTHSYTTPSGRRYPLSQKQLASRAQVSIGCLQGFESGTRRTGRDKLARIASACEMTVDELLAVETPAPLYPPMPMDSEWQAQMHLSDEALDVARAFMMASTNERAWLIVYLVEHLATRSDRISILLAQKLQPTPSTRAAAAAAAAHRSLVDGETTPTSQGVSAAPDEGRTFPGSSAARRIAR